MPAKKSNKIQWEYGIWKEWLPEVRYKMWHADDGCYKILRHREKNVVDKKWTLSIGWNVIGRFTRVEDAKKVAQLIVNG